MQGIKCGSKVLNFHYVCSCRSGLIPFFRLKRVDFHRPAVLSRAIHEKDDGKSCVGGTVVGPVVRGNDNGVGGAIVNADDVADVNSRRWCKGGVSGKTCRITGTDGVGLYAD